MRNIRMRNAAAAGPRGFVLREPKRGNRHGWEYPPEVLSIIQTRPQSESCGQSIRMTPPQPDADCEMRTGTVPSGPLNGRLTIPKQSSRQQEFSGFAILRL